eukprot:scaffold60563_cov74-Cyclotella_meneghiniana.AAC.1
MTLIIHLNLKSADAVPRYLKSKVLDHWHLSNKSQAHLTVRITSDGRGRLGQKFEHPFLSLLLILWATFEMKNSW